MSFHHIVLTKLHNDVDDTTRAEAVKQLAALGAEPGIIRWEVHESLDTRKGHIIVTNAEFVDQAAFESFRISEAHGKSGEFIREVADWWVGDYLED